MKPKVRMVPISQLVLDEKNANKGTRRGRELLGESLEKYGAGRAVVVDRHDRVTLPGGGATITFRYDPIGRQIQKTHTQGANATTVDYLYDADNLVEELDPTGNVLASYAQSGLIDEPLAMLRNGTITYYEADALGSVNPLSKTAGTIVQTYTFDSFWQTHCIQRINHESVPFHGT